MLALLMCCRHSHMLQIWFVTVKVYEFEFKSNFAPEKFMI